MIAVWSMSIWYHYDCIRNKRFSLTDLLTNYIVLCLVGGIGVHPFVIDGPIPAILYNVLGEGVFFGVQTVVFNFFSVLGWLSW